MKLEKKKRKGNFKMKFPLFLFILMIIVKHSAAKNRDNILQRAILVFIRIKLSFHLRRNKSFITKSIICISIKARHFTYPFFYFQFVFYGGLSWKNFINNIINKFQLLFNVSHFCCVPSRNINHKFRAKARNNYILHICWIIYPLSVYILYYILRISW